MIRCVPLFSGSGGNATYIDCDGEEFLIDAGVSCKALSTALSRIGTAMENIKGIFVTHEHNDHIKGLEIVSKKFQIPVYINENSAKYIYCNNGFENLGKMLRIMNPTDTVCFDNTRFTATRTSHDSWGSVCYRVQTPDDTFALATDIGYISKGIASALLGCRTVVLESNHDIEMLKNGPYPQMLKNRIMSRQGHLSNADCDRFLPHLLKSGTEKVFLAHLSKENNLPDLALEQAQKSVPGLDISVCPEKFNK